MITTDSCEYCGCTVRSDERNCPGCGAENPHYDPEASVGQIPSYRREDDPYTPGTAPRTIAQLRDFCEQKSMPLEKMRFFIGEDYRRPRAFGIYKDGDNFVVYKNKGDGSRAVRYRGPDEGHAVRELYGKLLEECHRRGIYPEDPSPSSVDFESTPPPQRSGGGRRKSTGGPRFGLLIAVVVFVLFMMLIVFASSGRSFSYSFGSPGYSGTGYNSYIYSNDDDFSDSFLSGSNNSWFSSDDSWSSSDDSWSSSDDSWSSSDWDSWDSWDSDWDSDW